MLKLQLNVQRSTRSVSSFFILFFAGKDSSWSRDSVESGGRGDTRLSAVLPGHRS